MTPTPHTEKTIRSRTATALVVLALGLALGACTRERHGQERDEPPPPTAATPARHASAPQITVVPVSDTLLSQAAAGGTTIRLLLEAAKPTIGTPYQWAKASLSEGIDCSHYTWLLYRAIGVPYPRYMRTKEMSTLRRHPGFSQTTFADARPGDMLIYGYRDDDGTWHGHVVILIDRTGHLTGHQGLMLGAHGTPVSAVRFVTTPGFEHGWFRKPEMRLLNVLRPVEPTGAP